MNWRAAWALVPGVNHPRPTTIDFLRLTPSWGLAALAPLWLCAGLTLAASMPSLRLGAGQAGLIFGAMLVVLLAGERWGAMRAQTSNATSYLEGPLTLAFAAASAAAVLLPPVVGVCIIIMAMMVQGLRDVIAVEDGRLPPAYGSGRLALLAGSTAPLLALLAAALI